MKPRGFGQRAALYCAWSSYAAALASALVIGYWAVHGDTTDPTFAALAASVVFFCGCGIVLHVIGRADLPDLRIGGEP